MTEHLQSPRARISPELENRLSALYEEPDIRFHVLARAAGLSPAKDFQARDLRALRFDDADLRGYNFSGSDLRGASLRSSRHIDASTRLTGALVDEDDAAWIEERRREDDRGREDERATLRQDLRRAIDQGLLELVLQPKVGLQKQGIIGAEALLRWQHPEQGQISPATFMPLLEEMDLIEAVTYWTIEAAIQQQRVIRGAGFDIVLSLNVSPVMLDKADFLSNCQRLFGNESPRLCFELPETALVADLKTTQETFSRLKALGIAIAIDDFGVGFSSLSILKDSGVDELKIDRSFVARLVNSNPEPLLVRSAIDLAHSMGMQFTAEGVETSAQLALLSVMGCDAAQGFLISRPLQLDVLIEYLRASPELPIEPDLRRRMMVSS